ncbi:MAG: hypothetical protein ABL904_05680 [Hyphomicrobiaceae bacterium]
MPRKHLVRVLSSIVCLALLAPQQVEAAKPRGNTSAATKIQPFTAPEHILRFIDRYRVKPEPERLPEMVKAASALGLYRDMEGAGVHVGFMAGIIGTNRDKAETLIGRMFPLPPEDQVAVVRAIAYSGLPDWKELLGKFVERMPAKAVLIERHLSGRLPTLQTAPMEKGPAILDANWGYYFATGSPEPVDRIIATLAWAKEANDIEKLTLAGMAKWTLANNANRDTDLLRHMKEQAAIRGQVVSVTLKDVIEAVETSETARIRKDAVAGIDELRAKGPEKNRNLAWWAQAGTTAIAAGCIVAGALGQVEFGLPCIIGGPLSTAAAKYLIPTK